MRLPPLMVRAHGRIAPSKLGDYLHLLLPNHSPSSLLLLHHTGSPYPLHPTAILCLRHAVLLIPHYFDARDVLHTPRHALARHPPLVCKHSTRWPAPSAHCVPAAHAAPAGQPPSNFASLRALCRARFCVPVGCCTDPVHAGRRLPRMAHPRMPSLGWRARARRCCGDPGYCALHPLLCTRVPRNRPICLPQACGHDFV
ncbi:hypothetical protein B0H14DRAFT_2686344 [Mycena olivaceomarginata]|nr:hypothetical protein B0H14DRAFT_2686344 [Mycena olivaceomarginata]